MRDGEERYGRPLRHARGLRSNYHAPRSACNAPGAEKPSRHLPDPLDTNGQLFRSAAAHRPPRASPARSTTLGSSCRHELPITVLASRTSRQARRNFSSALIGKRACFRLSADEQRFQPDPNEEPPPAGRARFPPHRARGCLTTFDAVDRGLIYTNRYAIIASTDTKAACSIVALSTFGGRVPTIRRDGTLL